MPGFTDCQDLGFLPLQDHAAGLDGTPLSVRQQVAAGRITRMTDPREANDAEATLIEFGREHGLGTIGDVHPWLFWQTRDRATRGTGSWAQAVPALTVDADGYYGSLDVQPIRDWLFTNDTRYRRIEPAWPFGISHPPRGALMTVLSAMEESVQHEVAMWTDPRLVAPSTRGPGECGTLVVDLQPTHELCMDGSDRPGIGGRHARLQSLMRVIAIAEGDSFAGLGGGGNVLALNFSRSAVDQIPNYGAVFGLLDHRTPRQSPPITGGPSNQPSTPRGPITPGSSTARSTFGEPAVGSGAFGDSGTASDDEEEFTPQSFGEFKESPISSHGVAMLSSFGGAGPLHLGAAGDKHNFGKDRDGHPINAGHISTSAFFYEDAQRDAPILFEGDYPQPPSLPIPAKAHISYDGLVSHYFQGRQAPGYWRLWCETPDVNPAVPPVTGDPPGNPPWSPGGPTPGGPPVPGGPGAPGAPGAPTAPGAPVPTGSPGAPSGPTPGAPGRPITPNPGGKRWPKLPPTGPVTGPHGPKPLPPVTGPTTGGSGGQPSVPCKRPAGPETDPNRTHPTTLRTPSDTPPVRRGGAARTGRRGRGGGRGTSWAGDAGSRGAINQSFSPSSARRLNLGESEIMPGSGFGRSSGGSHVHDIRDDLDRWSGLSQIANTPQVIPGVVERVGAVTREEVGLYALFRPMAQGFAALQFRPQLTIDGFPNFEHNPQMPAPLYLRDEAARPQVLAMHAWGAQGDCEWNYTERPEDSRARGGTGDGGVFFHPPRFELSDYLEIGSDPRDVTDVAEIRSTQGYVLAAPGVAFALGVPTADGGLASNAVVVEQDWADGSIAYSPLVVKHNDAEVVRAYDDGTDIIVELAQGGNGAVRLPRGTSAQRPSGVAGYIRIVTDVVSGEDVLEWYDSQNSTWRQVSYAP